MSTENSGILPVMLLLGVLLFAALLWCMLSSCLGRSFTDAIRELWNMLVLSARSDTRPSQWSRRRDWDSNAELFEMEYRGRGRAA